MKDPQHVDRRLFRVSLGPLRRVDSEAVRGMIAGWRDYPSARLVTARDLEGYVEALAGVEAGLRAGGDAASADAVARARRRVESCL